ncbi:hypothetical protein A3197_02755 [Candidatus Thiodiazotropha endoloripes]|nr:hypothetical protein A3197_02755 [Candidatus Thiodiazotropha endoloripes]
MKQIFLSFSATRVYQYFYLLNGKMQDVIKPDLQIDRPIPQIGKSGLGRFYLYMLDCQALRQNSNHFSYSS